MLWKYHKAASIKDSKRIKDNQIYFKLNEKSDAYVGTVYWGNKYYSLKEGVEVKIDPWYKNDSIIIESDLIPYQYYKLLVSVNFDLTSLIMKVNIWDLSKLTWRV